MARRAARRVEAVAASSDATVALGQAAAGEEAGAARVAALRQRGEARRSRGSKPGWLGATRVAGEAPAGAMPAEVEDGTTLAGQRRLRRWRRRLARRKWKGGQRQEEEEGGGLGQLARPLAGRRSFGVGSASRGARDGGESAGSRKGEEGNANYLQRLRSFDGPSNNANVQCKKCGEQWEGSGMIVGDIYTFLELH